MKSVYLGLLLLLGCVLNTTGQRVQAGLKVSGAVNYGVGNVQSSTIRFGYQGGATATIAVLDSLLFIQPELLYSVKGDQAIEYGPSNKRVVPTSSNFPALADEEDYVYIRSIGAQLNYLDLPLLLKANVFGIYVEAGPQVSYLLSSKYNAINPTNQAIDPVTSLLIPTATYRKLDVGYVLGFGYQDPAGFNVGWRYSQGLRSIYEPIEANGALVQPKVRNLSIQFYLGYQLTHLFNRK